MLNKKKNRWNNIISARKWRENISSLVNSVSKVVGNPFGNITFINATLLPKQHLSVWWTHMQIKGWRHIFQFKLFEFIFWWQINAMEMATCTEGREKKLRGLSKITSSGCLEISGSKISYLVFCCPFWRTASSFCSAIPHQVVILKPIRSHLDTILCRTQFVKIDVTSFNTTQYGLRSLKFTGSRLWNSLPSSHELYASLFLHSLITSLAYEEILFIPNN